MILQNFQQFKHCVSGLRAAEFTLGIAVPDWLITSHLAKITSSDWLFTSIRVIECTPAYIASTHPRSKQE